MGNAEVILMRDIDPKDCRGTNEPLEVRTTQNIRGQMFTRRGVVVLVLTASQDQASPNQCKPMTSRQFQALKKEKPLEVSQRERKHPEHSRPVVLEGSIID